MSAHVILQKQTFNTKEKRDIIADIFKGTVALVLLGLFVKIVYEMKNGNQVKPEIIALPVVLSLAVYFINATLPYKIRFF
jgi:hypothetical protein